MRGDLRYRPAVDVTAGLFVVLAAVQAKVATQAADVAWQPMIPVDPLVSDVAAGAALVTGILLAVGSRLPGVQAWTRPIASALLLLAAAGWCLARVEPARVLDADTALSGGVESWQVTVPATGAVLTMGAFALAVVTRLRSDRRAGEIAAGAVVTLGAAELAVLCAAPGSWLDVPPPLYLLFGAASMYQWWVVLAALAVPAAALVVLWWLAGPRPGVRRIAARCRGACAAVAAILLVEAFLSVSGLPSSLPRVIALGAGALCAAIAAARWSLAPMLAPVAAVAGLASLLNHGFAEDRVRDVYFPEPAHWVLVGLVPVAVALLVLWGMERPAQQPLEPAGVPAVPQPSPTPLTTAAVATVETPPGPASDVVSRLSEPPPRDGKP